jgi:hypothetical protein
MKQTSKFKNFVFYHARRLFVNVILKFTKDNTFEIIHKNNYWGNEESKSGPGSSMLATQDIRQNLPLAIKKLRIKSIFDAPCGDMYWIADLVQSNIVDYLGGDIVSKLIEENKLKFPNLSNKIVQFDVLKDDFPKTDAWICRAFLYHLSFKDIVRALDNFYKSNTSYMFVTNSCTDADYKNFDIKSGFWRPLNLKLAPFYLPQDPILVIQDNESPKYKSEMLVYHREQINPTKTYKS